MSDEQHREFDAAIDDLLEILARQIARKHLREAPRGSDDAALSDDTMSTKDDETTPRRKSK